MSENMSVTYTPNILDEKRIYLTLMGHGSHLWECGKGLCTIALPLWLAPCQQIRTHSKILSKL